ncbi:MAG TPA: hypothetical protein VK887_08400 [Pseudonocardiaceae bacterium]|nr:hypothetical protein [Pseudonocardiaceae bacterium]
MSRPRELAAGGRAVEVEPAWLAGFLDRFAAGHGGAVATTVTPHQVDVTAVDGWTASVSVPFGSLSAQSGQLRCPFGGRMGLFQRSTRLRHPGGYRLYEVGEINVGVG